MINEDSTPAAGSTTAVAGSDNMATASCSTLAGAFPLAAGTQSMTGCVSNAPAVVSSRPLGDSRPGHYTAVLRQEALVTVFAG